MRNIGRSALGLLMLASVALGLAELGPARAAGGRVAYLALINRPPSVATQVQEVVQLVNQQRARAGCPAVTVNALLNAAAQRHSDDMAAHDFMGHRGSDGSEFWERIEATGYRFRSAGENVAAGQPSAQEVMSDWMRSAGHRANILDCTYREIGVGYASNPGGRLRHYWAQEFATPR